MVQVPPNVEVQAKLHSGNEAAAYLEGVVNANARDGWEFYRVDEIGVRVKPGCLGGLRGQKASFNTYYVISFRKQG
jgi:hypothetical protein